VYGYHVANVAIYTVVCVLFLLFCDRFIGCKTLSTFASLLFAAHPVHTEAVAGLAGRADLLGALFFLLSIMAYSCCAPIRTARSALAKRKKDKESDDEDDQDDQDGKAAAAASLRAEYAFEESSTAVLWSCMSVLLAGMGMLCKEQAVTALGVCLVYDLVFVDGLFLLHTPLVQPACVSSPPTTTTTTTTTSSSSSSSPFRTSIRFRPRHVILGSNLQY
jgi:hypothetical protein